MQEMGCRLSAGPAVCQEVAAELSSAVQESPSALLGPRPAVLSQLPCRVLLPALSVTLPWMWLHVAVSLFISPCTACSPADSFPLLSLPSLWLSVLLATSMFPS